MKVAVLMLIDTEDFGKEEFKKEIKKLINDIDEHSELIDFDMFKVLDDVVLENFILK